MSKVYNFTRKDKNRFRKVYRYIRKKPVYEYCTDSAFGMIAGYLDFQNSDGHHDCEAYYCTKFN